MIVVELKMFFTILLHFFVTRFTKHNSAHTPENCSVLFFQQALRFDLLSVWNLKESQLCYILHVSISFPCIMLDITRALTFKMVESTFQSVNSSLMDFYVNIKYVLYMASRHRPDNNNFPLGQPRTYRWMLWFKRSIYCMLQLRAVHSGFLIELALRLHSTPLGLITCLKPNMYMYQHQRCHMSCLMLKYLCCSQQLLLIDWMQSKSWSCVKGCCIYTTLSFYLPNCHHSN